MPDIQAIEGQALFDMPLNPGLPLHEIWENSQPFEPGTPYEDMRYYRPINLLMRQYFEHELMDGPADVGEAIETSERHLRLLNSAGLTVVRHAVELAPTGSEEVIAGLGRVVAYGASPFIENHIPLDQKQAHDLVPVSSIHKHILEPVHAYIKWCFREHESYILDDIFRADQYSIHTATKMLYLHDFDPVLGHKLPRTSFAKLSSTLFAPRVQHD